MADKFDMDFGASTLRRVKRMSEEEARFQGLVPQAMRERTVEESASSSGETAPLVEPGASLCDSFATLIARDDKATLGLAGCERIDTHIRREDKQRIKVFCANHGLTMRQVMAVAFEAVVSAMDEYDSRP